MNAPGGPQRAPVRFVVDASVAVKLLVKEPLSDRAQQVFRRSDRDPLGRLCVPDFFFLECANALWKYVRRFGYPVPEADENMVDLLCMPLEVRPASELAQDALDIAIGFDITAYDACYVALARRLGVPLVTADERLVRKFAGKEVDVRWLGDVALETAGE